MLVGFWGWTQVLVWLFVGGSEPTNWAKTTIAWSAPQICPNEEGFRRQVLSVLESNPQERALLFPQDIVARIEENKTGKGFPWQIHLVLGWDDDLVFRTLRSDGCDALVEATALIVLIAAEKRANPMPTAFAVSRESSKVSKRKLRVSHLRHELLGTVGIEGFEAVKQEYWTTPISMDYRFGGRSWRVQAALRYSSNALGRRIGRDRRPSAWLRILVLRPGACYLQRLTRKLVGDACMGGEIGWFAAQGVHVSKIAKVNRMWLAAWFAGDIDILIHETFSLVFRVEGAIPIVRHGLKVERHGEIYRVPAFALRPSLGFRWQIK